MWLWGKDFFEKPESIMADKNEMVLKNTDTQDYFPFT